jgi:hypothetical protein
MAVVDVEWSSHHHEWDSKNHGSLFIPFFNPNGIPCFWMNRYPIQKGKKKPPVLKHGSGKSTMDGSGKNQSFMNEI